VITRRLLELGIEIFVEALRECEAGGRRVGPTVPDA